MSEKLWVRSLKFTLRITFILLVLLSLVASCISSKKVLLKFPSEPKTLSNQTFNGTYINISDSSKNRLSLWQTLYLCKSFKEDTTKVSTKSTVLLKIKKNNKLEASLFENKDLKNKIELKIRPKKDYILIKRNLRLIPIPFLFFIYHEARVLLSNDFNNDLVIKSSRKQFIWIIFPGSIEENNQTTYKKF